MIKAILKHNVLTIKSGVTPELVDQAVGKMCATDEEGNELYCFFIEMNGEGELCKNAFVANSIVDGEYAITKIMPLCEDADEIKCRVGDNLLIAGKYMPIIVAETSAKAEAFDSVFEVVVPDTN